MERSKNRFLVGVSVGLLGVGWLTVGCGFITGCGTSPFGNLFGPSAGGSTSSKLRADLSSGAFSAEVAYDQQSSGQTLGIVVTGGTPGAVVEVSIGGVALGSITLDDTGSGRLGLSSSPATPDELPLPGEFKPPGAGDAVDVGDLSGSFDSVELELKAKLSSGGFRANVKYQVESDKVKFKVEVQGGEPNAVLDVTAAGVAIGSITVNGEGNGEMRWSSRVHHENEQPLPADFPALAAGDTVTVGSLSGALSADDGDEHDGKDDGDNDSNGNANDNDNGNDNRTANTNDNTNDDGNVNDNENDNANDN